jgi:ribosomal protein L40E
MMTSLGAPAILLIVIVAYAFFTKYAMVKVIVGAGLLVPGLIAIIYGFTMFNAIDYSLIPTLSLIASGIVLVTLGGLLLLRSVKGKRLLSGAQHSNQVDEPVQSATKASHNEVWPDPRPKAKPVPKQITVSETVCEECGAINSIRNTYCTKCGERLPNLSLLNRKRKDKQ